MNKHTNMCTFDELSRQVGMQTNREKDSKQTHEDTEWIGHQ